MPFYLWSTTAASNATSDPTINWAEGMSPSSVNDSARAMEARLREWGNDISGSITTAGASTAYTIASNQGFDTLAHLNGQMIAFVPHVTCGNPVTLNVDGIGAKPLRSSPGVELPSGALIQGTPYVATYNNADGAFYLKGAAAMAYAIPLGGMLPYIGTSAPNSSFALPYGQAISRTTYATLFSLVGTTFGAGDGSTTFNLPDLRGRAIFGLDNMGGSAAGRIGLVVTDNGTVTGTAIGSAGGSATHALTQSEMPSHSHTTAGPHTHNYQEFIGAIAGSAATGTAQVACNYSTVATSPTDITLNNTGGGTAHAILPPMMVLPFILRVI